MISFFTSLTLLLICALTLFTTKTQGFWQFFGYIFPAYLIICLQTLQSVKLVKVGWTKENMRPVFSGILQGMSAGIARGGSSLFWCLLDRLGFELPEGEFEGME